MSRGGGVRELLPAALAGTVAGGTAVVAAALLLYTGDGFLAALATVTAVEVAALAAGAWVGAGGDADRWVELVRRRWLATVVAFTAAAGYSAAWVVETGLVSAAGGQALGMVLLVAWPAYTTAALVATVGRGPGTGLGDEEDVAPVAAAALAGGAFGVVLVGGVLVGRVAAPPLLLAGVGVLAAGALLHGRTLGSLPARPTVSAESTPYGELVVVDRVVEGAVVRVLRVDGRVVDAARRADGEPVLAHHRAGAAWYARRSVERSLFLGDSALVLPRHVARLRPGSRIDVAVVDPGLARAGYGHFGVEPSDGIEVRYGSPRAWLDALDDAFDAIWLEVASGARLSLVSVEALRAAARRLAPGGTLLVGWRRSGGTEAGAGRIRSTVATVGSVLPDPAVYLPEGGGPESALVVAPGPRAPERSLGPLVRTPEEGWPVGGSSLVYRELPADPEDAR